MSEIKLLLRKMEKEIDRLENRLRDQFANTCEKCRWFDHEYGGEGGAGIDKDFGPDYCGGYEQSCYRHDVRYCFTPKEEPSR